MKSTADNPPTTIDKLKVKVAIIGDAFVDLLCVVDENRTSRGNNNCGEQTGGAPSMIEPGVDVLLQSPISILAGGSGINTATHLHSLIQQFGNEGERKDIVVEVQTVFNENDMYGKLLRQHASDIGFSLCNQWQVSSSQSTKHGTTKNHESNQEISTGHCVVVISQDGERSFLTHRGCVEHFSPATHINLPRLLSTTTGTNDHHLHVHIAGYYNLPHFWNGSLKEILQLLRSRHGLLSNERIGKSCQDDSIFIKTMTTSLVPQFDATNQWDGQLLDLLPCLDFLILNEYEARRISTSSPWCCAEYNDNIYKDQEDEKLIDHIAHAFHCKSPHAATIIVVTLGSNGAVAVQNGKVIYRYPLPVKQNAVVDTTGAGDAFAGGFLASLMLDIARTEKPLRQQPDRGICQIALDVTNDSAKIMQQRSGKIESAIRVGCAAGTACTMKKGASVPSTKEEVMIHLSNVTTTSKATEK